MKQSCPFANAVIKNDIDNVKNMLEDSHRHCFYPKQKHEHDEKTNLMIAAENGHDEIIKLLLDNGADINAKTKSFDGGSCREWSYIDS